MANIEIISVRFNLAKDDDRRLFEALQKRSDPGKRNEFIKQALMHGLAIELGEKPVAQITKKASKRVKGEKTDGSLGASEISRVAPAQKMSGDHPSLPLPDNTCAAETDPEVAALIGSIVQ